MNLIIFILTAALGSPVFAQFAPGDDPQNNMYKDVGSDSIAKTGLPGMNEQPCDDSCLKYRAAAAIGQKTNPNQNSSSTNNSKEVKTTE